MRTSQGWTYLVRRTDDSDQALYVAKRLKNKDRLARFQTEVNVPDWRNSTQRARQARSNGYSIEFVAKVVTRVQVKLTNHMLIS
jgi:hypothetical protein